MGFAQWQRVLSHALSGVDPGPGEALAQPPDPELVITAAGGIEAVRRSRDAAHVRGDVWPYRPTAAMVDGLPWARYHAVLRAVQEIVDADRPSAPSSSARPTDAESRRLLDDRPPPGG